MKGTLIVPLTKSPHRSGRIGKKHQQDWFRGIEKAVILHYIIPESEILVLSDVHVSEQVHEAEIYTETLTNMGVKSFRVIRECYETISQVNKAIDIANCEDKNLIFVSTWLHYPRVEWLIKNKKKLVSIKHFSVIGIPRPKEAVTDIILTILFPLIDMCDYHKWWLDKINERRKQGKH